MKNPASLLRLRNDGYALGVEKARQIEALERATLDDQVRISHAAIDGTEAYRRHIAVIADRVGCHVHFDGDEDYAVVAGQGMFFWGEVVTQSGAHRVIWEDPIAVGEGDSFVVPEGYAHQLRNTGPDELIILFGCADSHMSSGADRIMISEPGLRRDDRSRGGAGNEDQA